MAPITTQLSDQNLSMDLLGHGFDEEKVVRFLQAPFKVERAQELLKSHESRSEKARKGRYMNLCLHDGPKNQNWIVYDPRKHDPCMPKSMLKLLVKFAVYKPGNMRYLEYNTRTQSLRIRSARILAGKCITYSANGPVLQSLDEMTISESPTEQPEDAPTSSSTSKAPTHSDSELTDLDSEG